MSMGENPYEAPRAQGQVVGVRSGRRDDLRSVAVAQKGILVCILIYIVLVVVQFAIPANMRMFAVIGTAIVALLATVFVFMLATRVYGTGQGILLGILTLIPCLGLIVLLLINSKATKILRQNGVQVGFLGADLAQF